MKLLYFASAFCDPCAQTRAVLYQASKLVPSLTIAELDAVHDEAKAEQAGIRMTPTVIVLDANDAEVFRAEGVPTLNQVLAALARAV